MKEIRAGALISLLFVLACLSGSPAKADPKVRVICGIFPVFLIAHEILPPEHFQLELLLPDNVGCSHHYSLTPGDMNRIAAAQIYVSAGKSLEGFFQRIVGEFPGLQIIDCSGVASWPATLGDPEKNGHLFSSLAGVEAMGSVLATEIAKRYPEYQPALNERIRRFDGALTAKKQAFHDLGISGKRIPIALIHNSLEFGLREVGFQIVEEIDSDGDHNTVLSPRELLQKIDSFREKGVRAIFYDTLQPPPVAETLSEAGRIPLIRWHSLTMRPVEVPLEETLNFTFDANLKMLKQCFSDEQD
jgi:ABC-type Zn uptake system ZnuABC Zn-binding protein ZnuA